MTISEPVTLATDYLLGTVSELCGVVLLMRNHSPRQTCVTLWAVALMAAATASYAGGTYHGLHHLLSPPVAAALWKITTISMGVASFLLLAAAIRASFSGRARRWLTGAAAVKLVAYVVWMLGHDEFRYVILDYGSTLVMLMVLVIARRTSGADGHRAFVASGILVSIAAALAQQSGVRLHQYFNHNDLMHVIQLGGVWLLFRGGARLRDHQPPSQLPTTNQICSPAETF